MLVEPELAKGSAYLPLRPFLRTLPPPRSDRPISSSISLLTVGMMRSGDKAASYALLAEALSRVDLPWRLTIVGDGPERPRMESAFASFGSAVTFFGALPPDELAALYCEHDLFLWPAIREAYGMALLEAQGAGLPVLAGDAGGVGDIVREGVTGRLVPEGDVTAFADALSSLLRSPGTLVRMSVAARETVWADHAFEGASDRLSSAMIETLDRFRERHA